MRTISKRTQYGLKAVIALGRRYGEGPVLIATLSTEETIPLKFLEGILLDLKGRGGTCVDGQQIRAMPLESGNEISFADFFPASFTGTI